MGDTSFFGRWARMIRRKPEVEVDDELPFHLEERVREYVAGGMSPEAARAAALERFGNFVGVREECAQLLDEEQRAEARRDWLSDLRQDVRYAGRTLRRSPGFTATAVLTLALGIGAATAIFTVVDDVLLRPLGVEDPDRLVVLTEYGAEPGELVDRPPPAASPANLFDWREAASPFSSIAYFVQWARNLTGDGEPQEVQVQFASADLFSTLGAEPLLGRGFRSEEDDVADGAALSCGSRLPRLRAECRSLDPAGDPPRQPHGAGPLPGRDRAAEAGDDPRAGRAGDGLDPEPPLAGVPRL